MGNRANLKGKPKRQGKEEAAIADYIAKQLAEENVKRCQKILNKFAEMRALGAKTDDELAAALNAVKFRHEYTKTWEGKQIQGVERWAQKKLGLEQRPLKPRVRIAKMNAK